MKKKIIVLGASGSIGAQALNVIRNNSNAYELTKISIGYNHEILMDILNEFKSIEEVAILDSSRLNYFRKKFPNVTFRAKEEGILELIDNDYDIVLNAIIGFAGLLPSIKVIKQNRILALANKETMVVAGALINGLLHEHPYAKIVPVDSEHCAIFQCLHGNSTKEVKRLLISASGGSFRDKTLSELKNVSVSDALAHPNWNMGAAITIDSATMFNKGLEVIEAHHLFEIPYEKIDVLLHRQSIVHSMVEFVDSSIIAQLSKPNMEQPIAYAFAYPKRRLDNQSALNFDELINLTFEPIDLVRYKALALSYEAGKRGNSYPCVLNASKEIATKAFLNEEIPFLKIVDLVEKALSTHKMIIKPTLEQLIQIDLATRKYVDDLIKKEILNGNN